MWEDFFDCIKCFMLMVPISLVPTKQDLEFYLTPLALAIWIMDDGCNVKSGIRIATNKFSKEETNGVGIQVLISICDGVYYSNY